MNRATSTETGILVASSLTPSVCPPRTAGRISARALLSLLAGAFLLTFLAGCASTSSREPLNPYVYNPGSGYPAVGAGPSQHL